MTDTPDSDDLFADLVASVEIEEPTDAINVRELDNAHLSAAFNDVRDRLIALSEMMEPKTEEGRELHSRRAAYLIEMSRRGMR